MGHEFTHAAGGIDGRKEHANKADKHGSSICSQLARGSSTNGVNMTSNQPLSFV